MRHNKKVPLFSLLGTQVIGFTAVALIGRFADPVRPYLVAKKTGEPLSSQIAVYIVERLFDFGTMALIVSSVSILAALPTMGSSSHSCAARLTLCNRPSAMAGLLSRCSAVSGLVCPARYRRQAAAFLERVLRLAFQKLGARRRTAKCGISRRPRHHAQLRRFRLFGIALARHVAPHHVGLLGSMRAFTASPQLAAKTLLKCILLLMSAEASASSSFRSWAGSPKSPLWPRRSPASLA